MNVLGLFSGIGGFELGLQRAGFTISAMCELDPFCQSVLAKNFPGVPVYEDVRNLTAERLEQDGRNPIDLVCGGFPCQDISVAGKRKGIAAERSGLWTEFSRLVGELRPRFAIVENTPGIAGGRIDRWLGTVLGDLASLGFDAEWHGIPASAVGACQQRDRVWIIAHADSGGRARKGHVRREATVPSGAFAPIADALRFRLENRLSPGFIGGDGATEETLQASTGCDLPWWSDPPRVGHLVHGLSRRMAGHRRRAVMALGNAVVPQIAELLGRAILDVQWGDEA